MIARPMDLPHHPRAAVVRPERLEPADEDVIPGKIGNGALEVLREPPVAGAGKDYADPVTVEVSPDYDRSIEVGGVGDDGPGLVGLGEVRRAGWGLEMHRVDPGGVAPDDQVRPGG